jgi:ADP-heptose:LPS heptosyltransferase
MFARVIELARPELKAEESVERYQRVRQVRSCDAEPSKVYVLSRVTLGADVAVTSIVLDAMKRRFPDADIYFVGPRKNWELFEADARIDLHEFAYSRAGSIAERLSSWPVFGDPDSIVVDPDSRLSQLGLLPVCPEDRYYFFESRAYGGNGNDSLVKLTRQWVERTFGVADANPYIAPMPAPETAEIVVSLGVGDNPEKRLDDAFEERTLRALVGTGRSVLIDEGGGGEETERVRRHCAAIPALRSWSGAYAPFAYAISKAKLYVGYDSAGQHVAAACGTPLISMFAGYPTMRMFHRWKPGGTGRVVVIRVPNRSDSSLLDAIFADLKL